MSNIRDAQDGQYIHFHFNSGVTHTNKIVNIIGYSNRIWYKPKGIANILSLRLMHKHHIFTYNSQYGNKICCLYPTAYNIQDDQGWSLLPQYEAPSQK